MLGMNVKKKSTVCILHFVIPFGDCTTYVHHIFTLGRLESCISDTFTHYKLQAYQYPYYSQFVTSGRGLCMDLSEGNWSFWLVTKQVVWNYLLWMPMTFFLSWKSVVQHKGIIEFYSFTCYFLFDMTFDAIVNAYHSLQCLCCFTLLFSFLFLWDF